MVRGDVGDEWPFRAPPRSATTVPSWNIDTLLPTPPPSRIYVKSNLQKGPNRLGVLAFKLVTCNDELDEECTVADLKTRIYDRLMLAPNQAVHLTSWGRPLPDDKMLVDLAVPTNGRIEMKLGYQVPDPNRGLERLYVTSTCISTRRVQADARTTVLDLKLSLQQCLMKGEHEWWEADGTCVKMSGTTLLGAANSPADPKQGTDEVLLGEELMIEEKLHLQGGKGAVTMRRMGPDRVGNRVTDGELEKDVLLRAGETMLGSEPMVVILDLPPEKMRLQYLGRALGDEEVLYDLGLRNDDSVELEFASPVEPPPLQALRAPAPPKKDKKAEGGGKKKK